MSFQGENDVTYNHMNELLLCCCMFKDLIKSTDGFDADVSKTGSVNIISYPVSINFIIGHELKQKKKKTKKKSHKNFKFRVRFGIDYPRKPLHVEFEESNNINEIDLEELKSAVSIGLRACLNQPQLVCVITIIVETWHKLQNCRTPREASSQDTQDNQAKLDELKDDYLAYMEVNKEYNFQYTPVSKAQDTNFSDKYSLSSDSIIFKCKSFDHTEKSHSILKAREIFADEYFHLKSYDGFDFEYGKECKIHECTITTASINDSFRADFQSFSKILNQIVLNPELKNYFSKIISFSLNCKNEDAVITLVEYLPPEEYGLLKGRRKSVFLSKGDGKVLQKNYLKMKLYVFELINLCAKLSEFYSLSGFLSIENAYVNNSGQLFLSFCVIFSGFIYSILKSNHINNNKLICKHSLNCIKRTLMFIFVGRECKNDSLDFSSSIEKDISGEEILFQEFIRGLDFVENNILNLKDHTFFSELIEKEISGSKSDDNQKDFLDKENLNKKPRLFTDFDNISTIGKGGFGCVLKARNKIENRYYAIKCVKVDPSQSELLIREIRTLSSLHHENIVRYYTSWKDTFDESLPWAGTDESEVYDSISSRSCATSHRKEANDTSGWIQVLPKKMRNFSTDAKASGDSPSVYKSESWFSSEQADDVTGNRFWRRDSDSTSESEDSESQSSEDHETDSKLSFSSNENKIHSIPHIIIQMELYEERTLRKIIDSGQLVDNFDRTWALFRELLDGIAYIHAQGVIHRDLKPANIMLDENDHVKIGDFGLATWTKKSRIVAAKKEAMAVLKFNYETLSRNDSNSSLPGIKSSKLASDMTRNVGTYLYVSPEVIEGNKTHGNIYNERVDIYSLGVILFEMFYNPIETMMERVTCLTELRKPNIEFPSDWDESKLVNQSKLIKLMMKHDPLQRPNASDLLASDLVPPLKSTEYAFRKQVLDILENPDSRMYKFIAYNLFNSSCSNLTDFCFDLTQLTQLKELEMICPLILKKLSLQKHENFDDGQDTSVLRGLSYNHLLRVFNLHDLIFRNLHQPIEHIFLSFGAVTIEPSDFLPVNSNTVVNDCPLFLDSCGTPVYLADSLHVNFARLASRCATLMPQNKTDLLRRFQFSKIYSKSSNHLNLRAKGVYPHFDRKDKASYDILSLDNGYQSFLELIDVLHMISDVLFPVDEEYCCITYVNHTDFIKAMLMECGFDTTEALNGMWKSLCEQQDQTVYTKRGDGSHIYKRLNRFMKFEHENPNELKSLFTHIAKKVEIKSLLASAVNEMKAFLRQINCLSVRKSFKVIFTPRIVHSQSIYKGITFSYVVQKRSSDSAHPKKQFRVQTNMSESNLNKLILAQGGRYEWLLKHFKPNDMYEEVLSLITGENPDKFPILNPKNGKKVLTNMACGFCLNVDLIMKFHLNNLINSSFTNSTKVFVEKFLNIRNPDKSMNLNSPRILICWQQKVTSSIPRDACQINTSSPLRVARDLSKMLRYSERGLTNAIVEIHYEEERDPLEAASECKVDAVVHISLFTEQKTFSQASKSSKSAQKSSDPEECRFFVLYKLWCLSEASAKSAFYQDLLISILNMKSPGGTYIGGESHQFRFPCCVVTQLQSLLGSCMPSSSGAIGVKCDACEYLINGDLLASYHMVEHLNFESKFDLSELELKPSELSDEDDCRKSFDGNKRFLTNRRRRLKS